MHRPRLRVYAEASFYRLFENLLAQACWRPEKAKAYRPGIWGTYLAFAVICDSGCLFLCRHRHRLEILQANMSSTYVPTWTESQKTSLPSQGHLSFQKFQAVLMLLRSSVCCLFCRVLPFRPCGSRICSPPRLRGAPGV